MSRAVAPGIRERDSGGFQVRVSYTDPAGKVRTVTATCPTITDARKKQRELKARADRGQLVGTSRQTVKTWLAAWIVDCEERDLAPYTLKGYRGVIDRYIVPIIGNVELGALNAEHVRLLMRDLKKRKHHRTGEPLSDRTRQHVYRVLHTALEAAVDAELIPANPARKKRAKAGKVKAATMHTLTAAQLGQLLEKTRETGPDQLYAVVLLGATLGLRRGELLALRWSDVDPKTRSVRVERAVVSTGHALIFREPKTEKSRRTLTMPSSTARELKAYMVRQKARRLEAGPLWHDEDLIVDNGFGRPWNPDTVSGAFTAVARELELPITLHGLRHTFASLLLAAGESVPTVAAMLGHSTPMLTLNVYAHAMPDANRLAADRFDVLMKAARA